MKRPNWILGAGWLVFLLYAYPGYMGSDSANQLVDSRVGFYTDWQAPIVTEIWRLVENFISGPAGMLLLQSGLLLLGAYQLARRVVSDRSAAIVAICALALPPAAVTTALLTPEALLPGLLLCAAAAWTSNDLRFRVGGFVLVVLACGLHSGARYAALPLMIALLVRREQMTRTRRLALSLAAWVAAVMLAWGISYALTDLVTERTELNLAARDIYGTLQRAPAMRDEQLRPLFDGVILASSTQIQKHARANELLVGTSSAHEREALFAARRALIRAQPAAYLKHRSFVFLRALGITRKPAAVYTQFVAKREHASGLQHLARHSVLQRALIAVAKVVAATPLMRPYLYLALAIVLLVVAARRRYGLPALLALSGIAYELSLFISTSRAEYRDSHWLIVSTIVATALLIAQLVSARSSTSV
ncbi:MAG TPA: hypothetical protein VIV40_18655 [Kofleriaceae bacterium]